MPAGQLAGPDRATPLFLDTSGLFAYFHPRADEHDCANEFFQAIMTDALPYRPLYTNTYVVDELVTLLQSKATPSLALEAFGRIVESTSIELLYETESAFAAVGDSLRSYDDHDISFTDHLIATMMTERNVDHVFAFDGDFETLGLTPVPY